MSDFYQVPLENKNDKDFLKWEKLNFILRRIFDTIGNVDGRSGPIAYKNSLSLDGNPIQGGPTQATIKETDFVTKSYFRSPEFGRLVVALLSSSGKTPLSIQGSTGTPSSGGGGGGGTSDHALLTNLSYATAGHTGFVPAVRTISTTAPITGGGDLSADRTIAMAAATGAVDGYLKATDWTIFNGKQNALTFGNLTELTSSVLTIGSGTGVVIGSGTTITVKLASGAQDGYLSATNWTTFNGKIGGSGTIGNIPKFSASSTLTDSIIKEASSKIGIGTAGAPAYTLEVQGQVKATGGSILPAVVVLTDAATIATDASLGNHFRVTLAGNRTLGNVSNVVDGQRFIWEFLQDATGGRTITLDSKYTVPLNMPDIILSTGANKNDMLAGIYNVVLDKIVITGFMKEYV